MASSKNLQSTLRKRTSIVQRNANKAGMSFSDLLQGTASLSVLASERNGTVRVVETRSVGYPLSKDSNSPTKKRSFQEVDLENGGTQKENKLKDKPIPKRGKGRR